MPLDIEILTRGTAEKQDRDRHDPGRVSLEASSETGDTLTLRGGLLLIFGVLATTALLAWLVARAPG